MHPWHDIPVDETAIAGSFPVVIEIPKGSKNKYELDKHTGFLRLDRVLYSAVHYPADYGFLPRSYCDDGDPLDVLVLGQEPVYPLTVVLARAVGVMRMRDDKGVDDKIVAVSVRDPSFEGYTDKGQLPAHVLRQVQRFFQDYKVLEHKQVVIEDMLGPDAALRIIRESLDVSRSATNDLSILIAENGIRRSAVREEWPVPKSSMAIGKPCRRSRVNVAAVASRFPIATLSVISRPIALCGTEFLCSSAAIRSGKSSE